MIVEFSRIRVLHGDAEALAERYRRRERLAESVPGCLGIEVLRYLERPDEFVVTARWVNGEAYEAYRRHPAFRAAHARVRDLPDLRIDPDRRAIDRYEVLS